MMKLPFSLELFVLYAPFAVAQFFGCSAKFTVTPKNHRSHSYTITTKSLGAGSVTEFKPDKWDGDNSWLLITSAESFVPVKNLNYVECLTPQN